MLSTVILALLTLRKGMQKRVNHLSLSGISWVLWFYSCMLTSVVILLITLMFGNFQGLLSPLHVFCIIQFSILVNC